MFLRYVVASVVLIGAGLLYATRRFSQQTDELARQLLAQSPLDKTMVTPEMLVGLPAPVQAWLTAAGVVGRERVHTVRLRQHALMRTSPTAAWMPIDAVQYFGVDVPGFVWKANARMMGFLPLAGYDAYVGGKGRLLMKALSVVPVADAADDKVNQGEMVRFLAEMCLFPSAALSPYLTWQAIDTNQAEVAMTDNSLTVKAVFAFNAQHQLASVTARRYYGEAGEVSRLETWFMPMYAWKSMHGTTIPVQGDVIWKLSTGDINYFRWEVTDIDYNKPILY